jgi:hypothetical protein
VEVEDLNKQLGEEAKQRPGDSSEWFVLQNLAGCMFLMFLNSQLI